MLFIWTEISLDHFRMIPVEIQNDLSRTERQRLSLDEIRTLRQLPCYYAKCLCYMISEVNFYPREMAFLRRF